MEDHVYVQKPTTNIAQASDQVFSTSKKDGESKGPRQGCVKGKKMTDDAGPLGIYYKCLHGANAHLAMSEDDSFAIEDTLGRSWICYPVKSEVVENLDLLTDLPEIDETDNKLGRDVETDVRLVFCEQLSQLRDKLSETGPDG